MLFKVIFKKILLIFIPLLAIYVLIILVASRNELGGDEGRYIRFAINLSHGFYTTRNNVDLWNGPGYPIILMPFSLLKIPWLMAKLLNALFLWGGLLYFYCMLRLYIPLRHSFYFSYLIGIYPPFFQHLGNLLTETFAIFLICGFMFHFCRHIRNQKRSYIHLIIAAFYLGYLALTKIIFGYVIEGILVILLLVTIWRRIRILKMTAIVFGFALLVCTPYLLYTYSITGKILYWGNSGGMSLYWMSTPFEAEYGDWFHTDRVYEDSILSKNHKEFIDSISKLSSIERDNAFKKKALQNIINNPKKFVSNWLANVGRLLLNYPYSYTPQKLSTYAFLLPNMFIAVMIIFCLYPTLAGNKLIPGEIFILLGIAAIAFLGSSLLSASVRQFLILVPIICFWIIFVLIRVLRIGFVRKLRDA